MEQRTAALDKLIPLVQPELHRLAHYYLSREGEGQTLHYCLLTRRIFSLWIKHIRAGKTGHTFSPSPRS